MIDLTFSDGFGAFSDNFLHFMSYFMMSFESHSDRSDAHLWSDASESFPLVFSGFLRVHCVCSHGNCPWANHRLTQHNGVTIPANLARTKAATSGVAPHRLELEGICPRRL